MTIIFEISSKFWWLPRTNHAGYVKRYVWMWFRVGYMSMTWVTFLQNYTDIVKRFGKERPQDAKLLAGYAEAIGDIDEWAGYAGSYYRTKWDIEGCLAKHRAILAGCK